MEFRLLGATEVLDATRLVELPRGRGRALLAILALRAGQPVAAERLIDELWSDTPPPTATTVVQGLVSRLRKSLDPGRRTGTGVLETVGKGYRLAVDPDCVDAILFERLLREAEGKGAATRAGILTAALDLWRGPAMADFTYEPFAQSTIRALEESRVRAGEDLLEAELDLGHAAEVVPRVRELIDEHPYRERLHGLLMTALYRSGRQADALAAYQVARDQLLDDLGIEPGAALQSLEAAILRQDRSLEAAPSRVEPTQRAHQATSLRGERRPVTVVVVDVAPSADDPEDAEMLARARGEASGLAAQVLASHGGRVEKSLGDELVVFFGLPSSREDDPLRAVRAVLDARTRVQSHEAAHGVARGMQAGIETGDVLISGPGGGLTDVVTGPVISTARRLALAAAEGDVLVGPRIFPLVSGVAEVTAVERAGGWRVDGPIPPSEARPRDGAMVGRNRELGWLRVAFRRALRDGAPVTATVVGDPGIGKSRLAREFAASLGRDARAITIRCSPPNDVLGFHPVRQAVLEAAGLDGWRGLHRLLETAADGDSAVHEVATAIGLRCPPATTEELATPMRLLLDALVRQAPLVVVLDDLHWADPAFLRLVERLEAMPGRVLLVGLKRPDPATEAPTLERADTLRLGPLTDREVARLVIAASGPRMPSALHRIVGLAQGNPLYAEQLLAAAEDGEVDAIPASLLGLLSMRLDRLGPGERDILRVASAGGLDIEAVAVRELLPPEARPFVVQHLESLVRKRFIERAPDGRLRFAHVLLQVAAYRSLTLEDRTRLQQGYQARSAPPDVPESVGTLRDPPRQAWAGLTG